MLRPIGGYFVWHIAVGGPLLLVAGGSRACPLMAMLRLRQAAGNAVPTRLLYSSRPLQDIIYRDERDSLPAMDTGLEVTHTLTRDRRRPGCFAKSSSTSSPMRAAPALMVAPSGRWVPCRLARLAQCSDAPACDGVLMVVVHAGGRFRLGLEGLV